MTATNTQRIGSPNTTDVSDPLGRQVGGSHYRGFLIQPIEFVQKNGLSFIEGCIIKYVCRRKGNRIQDLEKIIHYCEIEIKHLREQQEIDQALNPTPDLNPSRDVGSVC